MSVIRRHALALALTASAGACAATVDDHGDDPFAQRAAPTVQVTNNNWSDVNVYAVRFGMRYRLGTINSTVTRELRLPTGLVGAGRDLRLLADPIGGGQPFLTEPIKVSEGEWVKLTVENYLPVSSYAVWRR